MYAASRLRGGLTPPFAFVDIDHSHSQLAAGIEHRRAIDIRVRIEFCPMDMALGITDAASARTGNVHVFSADPCVRD